MVDAALCSKLHNLRESKLLVGRDFRDYLVNFHFTVGKQLGFLISITNTTTMTTVMVTIAATSGLYIVNTYYDPIQALCLSPGSSHPP